MTRTFVSFAIIAIMALVVGCSQSQSPVMAPLNDADRATESDGHVIWGYYQFYIDLEAQTVEVVPARQADKHANVKAYVTPPACMDCLKVQPTGPYKNNVLPIDVTLRNPTPLTGYDVRGILLSDDEGAYLINPDNFTDLFDNGGPININPFKAFAKEETNRAFGADQQHTEHYELYLTSFGKIAVIDYAIDASWPTRAKEPYFIHGPYQLGILDSYGLEECIFEANVDAANNDVNEVLLDLSSLGFAAEIAMELSTGNLWDVSITNEHLIPEGEYTCWGRASTASSAKYLYAKFIVNIVEGLPPSALTDDVQPVFNANCTTCHSSIAPPLDLDLTAGNAWSNLVNVDSVQSVIQRITPHNSFNSYVFAKILGIHTFEPFNGSDDQMPKGGDPLNFEDTEIIRAWIYQGAKDD
jgi:hypothetical protein